MKNTQTFHLDCQHCLQSLDDHGDIVVCECGQGHKTTIKMNKNRSGVGSNFRNEVKTKIVFTETEELLILFNSPCCTAYRKMV